MHFTSRDVERVEETWKQYVPSAALQRVEPARFSFDWTSAQLGDVSFVRYDLAAQVHSVAEPEDHFLACRVEAADAEVFSGRDALDARLPWLTDAARVEAKWKRGARVRALVFDRAAAQERVRQVVGDDHLVLRTSRLAPLNEAAGRTWERMFAYLEASLGAASDSEILQRELERHALAVTLTAFATSVLATASDTPQRRAAPTSVRRALSFIAENAHRPITVDDVAAAAFISTRGLQYAFRRTMDATPAEYLRRARLEGAHRDLRSGDGEPIAAIARRWGFSHPSRFAAAYREAYGVSPSTTAGRPRR
ncbi:helix-turn-helix transcriptional regulator [Microbacterium sp. 179-I 3D4 NHS]|uniref:helix-turn-helix transcriptional regulator n=1 Tax=Microbacterium sp. 179-I 3D4 NHS TaxID=3142381 RepID=UPI0039A1D79C